MSDIVERLWKAYEYRSETGNWDMLREAADEIERLEFEVAIVGRSNFSHLESIAEHIDRLQSERDGWRMKWLEASQSAARLAGLID